MTLATAREVATALGVNRSTVYGWAERYDDYPDPALQTTAGALWDLEAVRTWYERTRPRAGRPASL